MEVLESTVTQAYDLFTKKDFEAALDVLNNSDEDINNQLSTIEEDKRDEHLASIYNLKGFIYLGLGDNNSAKDSFEKGLQLNPNSSQACAGLGEVFFLNGRDEEAKIMLEWALDLNSQNEFAKNSLHKVNRSLALPDYHNSLEVDSMSEDELTIFNKCITDAYTLFKEKKFDYSLEKIEKAQELLLSGVMSNSTLLKISSLENFKGFNYLALENHDTAQGCFEKALNLDPRSSQACAGLGELFYLKRMDKESKTMFQFAVQHDPHNEFAVSGLKKVNEALGLETTNNTLEEKKAV